MNKMQVATTKPAPVRPYQRFPATKVCDTGRDAMGAYMAFVSKDPVTNLNWKRDHHKDNISETAIKIPVGKCPHGTTVHTYKLGMSADAKLDREVLGIKHKTFARNPTDKLSF